MNGTVIPDLGIFAFPCSLEIDFRMGTHWNPKNVEAFFQLLAYFRSIAPEAKIASAEQEGLVDETSFMAALRHYLNEG